MLAFPLILSLIHASPATAAEPSRAEQWVAVRADALHCVQTAAPQAADAPCLRLTGGGTDGAVTARLLGRDDGGARLAWARPPRQACLHAPPYGLPDLGLTVRVEESALLPVVSEATRVDLGGGAQVELRPGLPLWPTEDGGVEVHVAGLRLALPAPVPSAVQVTPSPGAWTALPAMQVAAEALPAVAGVALSPLTSGARLAASWDQAQGAVVLQDACARLVLPVAGGVAPGRPAYTGGPIHTRKVEATLSEGTVLVLPSGRPAGRVTANLVLGPYQAGAGTPGDVPLAPTQASTQGGRTCFDLPTSADLSLPIAERSLVLCTATRALK